MGNTMINNGFQHLESDSAKVNVTENVHYRETRSTFYILEYIDLYMCI